MSTEGLGKRKGTNPEGPATSMEALFARPGGVSFLQRRPVAPRAPSVPAQQQQQQPQPMQLSSDTSASFEDDPLAAMAASVKPALTNRIERRAPIAEAVARPVALQGRIQARSLPPAPAP